MAKASLSSADSSPRSLWPGAPANPALSRQLLSPKQSPARRWELAGGGRVNPPRPQTPQDSKAMRTNSPRGIGQDERHPARETHEHKPKESISIKGGRGSPPSGMVNSTATESLLRRANNYQRALRARPSAGRSDEPRSSVTPPRVHSGGWQGGRTAVAERGGTGPLQPVTPSPWMVSRPHRLAGGSSLLRPFGAFSTPTSLRPWFLRPLVGLFDPVFEALYPSQGGLAVPLTVS